MMKKFRKGQTMVEYIIIVCLIAIALIGVFALLRDKISAKTTEAASSIGNLGSAEASDSTSNP